MRDDVRSTVNRAGTFAAACLAAMTILAAAEAGAQATTVQATPPPVPVQRTVDCGAGAGDRNTCEADTSSGVALIRQTGDGNCALGKTWGFDSKGIWVANGCRGTFALSDDRLTVDCAAVAGARAVCEANTTAGVALVKGSAACMPGRTWGYDTDGIWVADGCEGTFVLTTRGARECRSDGTRQHCAADTSAGVVFAKPIATAPCTLGDSWGYDAAGVWVDKGCHAEFVLGNPGTGAADNKDLYDFFGLFEPYGRLRGQVAWFDDNVEVQDNSSFLGLRFSTRGAVRFFAETEWRVSLVQGGQEFNADAAAGGGTFPNLDNPQKDQVFGARLGNVGVDFGPGGRVTVGKQWAVHTDVTRYTTDQFTVFGSQASATYTAGTDGGFLGTGRADQVVTYRNTIFKVLRIGGQAQFKSAVTSETLDGAGASAQLTILPGVRLAGAYTRTRFSEDTKAAIVGLGGDAEYIAAGARIDWKVMEFAAVYVEQDNGDLVEVTRADDSVQSVAFDARGLEALLRFNAPGFAVYGGYNYYKPQRRHEVLDPRFRIRYGIAGVNLGIMRNMYAYAEARLFDESRGPQGGEGFDALAVGVHYGFTMKTFHRR